MAGRCALCDPLGFQPSSQDRGAARATIVKYFLRDTREDKSSREEVEEKCWKRQRIEHTKKQWVGVARGWDPVVPVDRKRKFPMDLNNMAGSEEVRSINAGIGRRNEEI